MHRTLIVFLAIATQTVLAEPTFHGNIARTGVYESAGPARGAQVKWTFKTGGPIVGSAAVVDGTVYMGSADNFLYALDQETGKEKTIRSSTISRDFSRRRRSPTASCTSDAATATCTQSMPQPAGRSGTIRQTRGG